MMDCSSSPKETLPITPQLHELPPPPPLLTVLVRRYHWFLANSPPNSTSGSSSGYTDISPNPAVNQSPNASSGSQNNAPSRPPSLDADDEKEEDYSLTKRQSRLVFTEEESLVTTSDDGEPENYDANILHKYEYKEGEPRFGTPPPDFYPSVLWQGDGTPTPDLDNLEAESSYPRLFTFNTDPAPRGMKREARNYVHHSPPSSSRLVFDDGRWGLKKGKILKRS